MIHKRSAKIFICSSAVMLLCSCSLMPDEEALPPAPLIREYQLSQFTKAAVTRGDIYSSVTFIGNYSPAINKWYSFNVKDCVLKNVYVSVGDQVHKGDLLAELRADDLEEQLQYLEYKNKRMELLCKQEDENYLLDNNIRHKEKITEMQDSIIINSLRIDELKESINRRKIYADIDGEIAFIMKYDEQYLSDPSHLFLRIADYSSSVFTASNTSGYEFTPGMEVDISVGTEKYPTVANPSEDGKTVTFTPLYNAVFDANTMGTVEIILDEKKGVLVLPSNIVGQIGNESYVYYEDEKGYKDLKIIQTGAWLNGKVEILGGLSEGELVIVN